MKKVFIKSFLASCFAICFFLGANAQGISNPVSAIVTFGQPPVGGGACTGNGLCSAQSSSTPGASGTKVTFSIDPADATMLLLTFKLADLLAQTDPEQQQQAFNIIALTEKAGTNPASYMWAGIYPLSAVPLFAPLNLLPGAQISPTTLVTVTCDGTTVVLHIKYDHQ